MWGRRFVRTYILTPPIIITYPPFSPCRMFSQCKEDIHTNTNTLLHITLRASKKPNMFLAIRVSINLSLSAKWVSVSFPMIFIVAPKQIRKILYIYRADNPIGLSAALLYTSCCIQTHCVIHTPRSNNLFTGLIFILWTVFQLLTFT